MSDDPQTILKRRLAEGAITLEEYRELLAEVQPAVVGKAEQLLSPARGRLLAEVDELRIYEDCLLYQQKRHSIADVTSVSGLASSRSINFVPTQKTTYLFISLKDDTLISMSENRTILGMSRHKALRTALAILRELTFKARLQNLTSRLIRCGAIELCRPLNGEGAIVTLTVDGHVESGTHRISLQQAQASGTLAIGTEFHALSGSFRSNPDEVVLSEKRGFAGALIPSEALCFLPWTENPDIVHALLKWMATPGNRLRQATA